MEFGYSIELTRLLLVLCLVLFCCITDIGMRRIPNMVLLPTLMVALLLNTLGGGIGGLVDSLGGLLVGIGMLLPLHLLGRMGAGDIKLLGVVGAILGPWGALVAGLATMMAGAVLGIAYVLWIVLKPGVTARARKIIGALSGSNARLADAGTAAQTARATEIPYAVAIAAGTVAALAYTGLLTEVIIT